ncbi:TRAP-type C4-dicarboxylate transport system, large permease component [Minicystis rosea]|nr:TRAP-type C4-dicarboxylate transport system, large permease component [Minicystis rosea]
MGVLLALVVIALALLGTPLFAVMGGASELLWLTHHDATQQFLRRIAPNVMEERFADSPILVTIPLFTFVGYLMAESKAPDRIVRAASAFFGWLPGGLAMVCIVASAFFTTLTGGSGVTIVAIGGLLYPALRKQGYPDKYALGLVTVGGSLGLLLPPSLPILVYALVAGIDFNAAFKAGIIPGVLIMVLLAVHAAYVGTKHGVPRSKPNVREMASALWLLKWELGVPVVILGGLGTHLTSLDESAALTAVYTIVVEFFIHKDLSLKKDLPRVAKASMVLAGAIILILSMANALINFVVNERIPALVLEFMLGLGLTQTWQFLVVLNIFLVIIGMLMEGFSAILVAVPLILPFAARFHLHPFHLAMMFLLNLELAYCAPPLGLNLFIASFRFDKPLLSLYRIVLPFTGILAIGLFLVMYVPPLSTVLVDADIRKAYATAEKRQETPREAWLMQCVQEDRSNPVPCTDADKAKFGKDGTTNPYLQAAPTATATAAPVDTQKPNAGDDDLMKQMMGDAPKKDDKPKNEDDDLMKQMMGETTAKPATSAAPSAKPSDSMDDLMKEMMGEPKK